MAENQTDKNNSCKQEYFPPKIVHTETMEGRASACALADDASCGAIGPIQS
jgi:hypothetical protein